MFYLTNEEFFLLGNRAKREKDCHFFERHLTTNRASQGLAHLHLDLVVSAKKLMCDVSALPPSSPPVRELMSVFIIYSKTSQLCNFYWKEK